MSVAVLAGVGRHPVSGRPIANPLDVAALEQALRLGAAHGVAVHAVHAGDEPASPALRRYLGMGIGRLEVVRVPPGMDVVEPLLWRLSQLKPGLILAGPAALSGEGSGLVPYLVARALGLPLVAGVRRVERDADGHLLDQALDFGKVRRLRARGPVLATIHPTAPTGRFSAFAAARRATVAELEPPPDTLRPDRGPEPRPARRRPTPIEPVRGASPSERLDRIQSGVPGTGARVLKGVSPEEAARQILAALAREGVGPWAARRAGKPAP